MTRQGQKRGPKTFSKGEQARGPARDEVIYGAPDWLSNESKLVFDEIMYQVKNYGVILPADIHGLAMY